MGVAIILPEDKGGRNFKNSTISRSDLMALTREAVKISEIS